MLLVDFLELFFRIGLILSINLTDLDDDEELLIEIIELSESSELSNEELESFLLFLLFFFEYELEVELCKFFSFNRFSFCSAIAFLFAINFFQGLPLYLNALKYLLSKESFNLSLFSL